MKKNIDPQKDLQKKRKLQDQDQKDAKNLSPYKHDKLASIPSWIKITLLKFWAAGAAFFFIGVGTAGLGDIAFQILFSLLLALMNDYVVRQIVKLMKNSKDNTFRYNLVNKTGVTALLLNLVYAFIIVEFMIIIATFMISNGLWFNLFGTNDLRADPFLAGFIFVLLDGLVILVRNFIYDKTKNK